MPLAPLTLLQPAALPAKTPWATPLRVAPRTFVSTVRFIEDAHGAFVCQVTADTEALADEKARMLCEAVNRDADCDRDDRDAEFIGRLFKHGSDRRVLEVPHC